VHSLNYIFAYHVETMTFDNEDYDLILEQDQELSKDPTTVAEDLTEVPNQSSENTNTTAPTLRKKASPGHNPLLYLNCNLCLFIYTYALCLGDEMKP
jgi:hypothetical protein